MGHTVDCICCMRGVSRISLTHHLYGRRARERVKIPHYNAGKLNHEGKPYPNEVVVHRNKADGSRSGTPWYERPLADRLWALEQIVPSTKRCNCSLKRVKCRKTPLLPLELVQAMSFYVQMPMGLTLYEFLTKTFGEDNLARMLQ